MIDSHQLQIIAVAHTPFAEKFAIPRQANLIPVPAQIELLKPFNRPEAVAGLEQVSHIWLTFIFDQHLADADKAPRLSIRPPRLGGNKKIGVFASRSSFRPNALGQSLVKLDSVQCSDKGVILHVTGIDLLDQTSIVDIKPYLPYADSVSDACNGIAPAAPEPKVDVSWQAQALEQLAVLKPADMSLATVKALIVAMIALDPRPAYKQSQDSGNFAMAVFGLDVQWQMQASNIAQIHNIIRR